MITKNKIIYTIILYIMKLIKSNKLILLVIIIILVIFIFRKMILDKIYLIHLFINQYLRYDMLIIKK